MILSFHVHIIPKLPPSRQSTAVRIAKSLLIQYRMYALICSLLYATRDESITMLCVFIPRKHI